MNRADLDRLDRDALIARAEAAGVARARILTRPELVDELLLRSNVDPATKQRSRGWFGVARDLLARAVERGLHLPDAADRIRTMGGPASPSRPSAPAALPTVTLAEIYASQGHRQRAIETLESVLAREPDHAAARALVAQLYDSTYPVPQPKMPPEEAEAPRDEPTNRAPAASASDDSSSDRAEIAVAAEPLHMLDDAPLPPHYDVDECIAIPVDPRTLYIYWEVRVGTLEFIRVSRSGGSLALRVIVVEPTWDGPRSSTRDEYVAATVGDLFIRDLPAGCVVRAAIGWRFGEGFVPIAHSPALETPPGAPSPLLAEVLVRWTPEGVARVSAQDTDAPSIERALDRARREVARTVRGARADLFLGGSERWAQPHTTSNG